MLHLKGKGRERMALDTPRIPTILTSWGHHVDGSDFNATLHAGADLIQILESRSRRAALKSVLSITKTNSFSAFYFSSLALVSCVSWLVARVVLAQ